MAAIQALKQFRLRELSSALMSDTKLSVPPKVPNPFLPHKNPDTGRWAPPRYSLRRQAELIKSARASNLLHLLPPGPKLGVKQLVAASAAEGSSLTADVWAQEVEWEGEIKEKEVPGVEGGSRLYAAKRRMFKGHKWERTKEKREEEQKLMMRGMSKRVERFKSTYRRSRPNPTSPPRNTSYTKLPF